jgi:hypothetical protein
MQRLFEQSRDLWQQLSSVLSEPLHTSSTRSGLSRVCCALSLGHCRALLSLLELELFPSALVLHRAQYEALVRGVWAFYAASDSQLEKLASSLSTESEQGAKNLPGVSIMLDGLSGKAPLPPYQALVMFKESTWLALNSFTHAGVHPIQRHASGFPVQLVDSAARNAIGLAVVAAMQVAVLSGQQKLMHGLAALQRSYAACLPAHAAA